MASFNLVTPSELWKSCQPIPGPSRYSSRLSEASISLATLLSNIKQRADVVRAGLSAQGVEDEEERILIHAIENATTLHEYQACAERLDQLQRNNEWKLESNTTESVYNPQLIAEHIEKLGQAQSLSDLGAMQHLLRTSLSRNLGGMNSLDLYQHSWAGTKVLIEQYIQTVLDTIEKFAISAVELKIDTQDVQRYEKTLQDSLKYFGRSALTLSGGAILGMKHIGVVKTLWEADLLPEIISGASAGSIVAAVVGVSNDEEMRRTVEVFPTADLACFDPPGTGPIGWLTERTKTWLQNRTLFSMNNMRRVLQPWLGDYTFHEAYNKTRRVLNICVSSADNGEPLLLNYMTAPDVVILSAVCASCSVPNVFPSASIYEKDPETKEVKVWMQHAKQMFVDGSLDQDIPMRKLSEMFNVNFFIVSQVNPHVRMFLDPEKDVDTPVSSFASLGWLNPSAVPRLAKHAIRREVLHRAQQLKNIGLDNSLLRWASVLSQQYTGDINIFPDIHVEECAYMLANPTPAFMLQATFDGERATWPKIWRIKNCVAIELALIRAIHILRDRVAFGPEARAAREARQRGGRGRSYRIRGQRPEFLRQRSLSIENHERPTITVEGRIASGPPSPGPSLHMRRNASLNALPDGMLLTGLSISRLQTPLATPQSSIDNPWGGLWLDDSLKMTKGTLSPSLGDQFSR